MVITNLTTPILENQIRKLHSGDYITVSGTIFTARDDAHARALEYASENQTLPFETKNGVLYHCGPVAHQIESKWEIVSAGPTTSTRLEKVEADFIKNFGIRIIIGKGGMLKQTTDALKQYGAIYCLFTGGVGALGASFIQKVEKIEWMDLGIPEAVWVLRVKDFGPLFVAIDSHGNNLFYEIEDKIRKNKELLLSKLG